MSEVIQNIEAQRPVKKVSRFKELPIWRKGITYATLGFSAIAAACSGNTTGSEPTTTPPITNVSTTTTTEAPTTIPKPSTTTSTTVPEVTTTTVEPIDCSIPSGEVNINGEILQLGSFIDPLHQYHDGEETVSVRLLDVYIKPYIDFQGENVDVAYIDVCYGSFPDKTPKKVSIILGRPDKDYINTTFYLDNNDITKGTITTSLYAKLSDILPLLEERLASSSQIGFIINTRISTEEELSETSFNSCVSHFNEKQIDGGTYCTFAWEKEEYIPNNIKLINQLKGPIGNNDQQLLENESIVIKNLMLFKP